MFPAWMMVALIVGSLVLTVVSVVALLGLLVSDYLNERLW